MKRATIHFVEPSKVGTYHISLIQGYLDALVDSPEIRRRFEIVLYSSTSTYENLSAAVRKCVAFRPIDVISQDRRKLIMKSIQEFFSVVRVLLQRRQDDIVFVSCVMPSALFLIELFARIFQPERFYVVIHGEIEGLFQKELQHVGSYGYWVMKWLQVRDRNSALRIVVLDDFIRTNLLDAIGPRYEFGQIEVIHHPIAAFSDICSNACGDPKACFVGYRTASKGFDRFVAISRGHPDIKCLAIGSGRIEDVLRKTSSPLESVEAYFRAISECTVAVFPYVSGYNCALSAAVIDAISCGVHIIATNRPCFDSLQAYFGPILVTVVQSEQEIDLLLNRREWLAELPANRTRNLELLRNSKYSVTAVRASFEALFLAVDDRTSAELA